MRWSVKGANNLRVETEFGSIVTEQRGSIKPRNTTTYELIASNDVGSVRAAVTVRVSTPPTAIAEIGLSPSTWPTANNRLKDVHVDSSKGTVAPEDLSILHQNASIVAESLALDPQLTVKLEAHSDSRGSDGYDLAVGDQDAASVKSALVSLGISEARLFIVSVGREQPLCQDPSSVCNARNRRVHFSLGSTSR